MSDFYNDLAATATELLKEFGTTLILRSVSDEEVYDPVTGELVPGGDPVDTPFTGLKMNPTEEYAMSMNQGTVQARDMLVMMEPTVREPVMTDSVVIDDEVWQVVNIRVEKPADIPLYYLVQVRP